MNAARLNSVVDIFLPRFCAACQKKLRPEEEVICPGCLGSIKRPDQNKITSEFRRKFEKEKVISEFAPAFLFEEGKAFQSLIHSIKYRGSYKNALFLGRLTGECLKDRILPWKCDMILPVPLHPAKRAERGYNQSYYIAKGLSRATGIPVRNNILKRKRFTETQTALSILERKANMKGAFGIKSGAGLEGKVIIVLDDVITSGSTVSECGRVLLEKGAEKVYAVSSALAL
ncbi:MAG: ComF family protein [Ignavibacteria bacterium]|nr:ComF family protein [Ignavibacteria bacterium]MCU7503194.1 ComF family protein [Ignavibacteria bacterium]MCU7518299.1 ComF family protein [Ignavibacteria bacterium]